MTLLDHLREHREALAQEWVERIFRTYPLETVGFLRKSDDPFSNPAGVKTRQAVVTLTAALLEPGLDSEAVRGPVDDIMRVRSVQDFTPSQAVAVMFFAKSVVRDHLKKQKLLDSFAPELLQFESKIDTLALLAMDVHASCREQLFEFRVKEVKRQQSQVIRLAKLKCEIPAEEPDPDRPF